MYKFEKIMSGNLPPIYCHNVSFVNAEPLCICRIIEDETKIIIPEFCPLVDW